MQTLDAPFQFISEKDNGIYDAMNKGISLASGKWLYFLGGDDSLYNKTILEKIAKELLPKFDVVSGKIQYQYTNSDARQIQKNKGVFSSDWSYQLWIKNTVHHQATFYNKELFSQNRFNTNYNVLADYEFNLMLFKNTISIKIIPNIVAVCSAKGISKKYNWSLYQEEIRLKTKSSSKLLWPLFFLIAFLKFLFKKT